MQAFGRALITDRRRMVTEMTSNPNEHLTRLAPAIKRQAGLERVSAAADFLRRDGDRVFDLMRNRVLTDSATAAEARRFAREQLNTPEGWRAFRQLYERAAEPYALQRTSYNRNERHPHYVASRFAEAMELLHQPGADGKTALQTSTPEQIALAATRRLVELATEHPQLQAFSPDQVTAMANGLRTPGTQHRYTMVAGDPPRLVHQVTTPQTGEPPGRAAALAVFQQGARTTLAGLTEAETEPRNNTMTAADLLPLAHQVQVHLVGELVRNPDEPNIVLMPAIMDLRDENRATEARVAQERARRLRTSRHRRGRRRHRHRALVAGTSGVGRRRHRGARGGCHVVRFSDHGARCRRLPRAFARRRSQSRRPHLGSLGARARTGLGASYTLNLAGEAAGFPTVAAQRLTYARALVAAFRGEGDAARRTSAVVDFLDANEVMTRDAWAALTPERQQAAYRLVERFGAEMSRSALQAILRFGAVAAQVNNAAGAVANVDHMYAAYTEMNVAEQRRVAGRSPSVSA